MTLFPHAGLVASPRPLGSDGGSCFRISETSRAFEGHFDGAPILPGVAHIALALETCAGARGRPAALVGLRDVRFSRPVGPGDWIEVVVAPGREPASMRFEIRSGGHAATTGLLLFAPRDDD